MNTVIRVNLLAAGRVVTLLLLPLGTVPAQAQQSDFIPDLVETTLDSTDFSYPFMTNGYAQSADLAYGNYSINPTWNAQPSVIGTEGFAINLKTIGAAMQGDVFDWVEPTKVLPFAPFACPLQDKTGSGCHSDMVGSGPATARFIFRQGGQSFQNLLPIQFDTLDDVTDGAIITSEIRLGNLARVGEFLNTEAGPLAIGPIHAGWLSAIWVIEPVGEGSFVRLANLWQQGTYLHTENLVLESGPIKPNWWSAMWQVIPVPGTDFFWLENRYLEGQYLHVEYGTPEVSEVGRDWTSAMWWALP